MDKIYEFKESEEKIYKHWEESGFFNPDNLALPPDAKTYAIVLPPPNVTGTLHIGHAGVLAFEDILIRYHRMKGERALWIPGTDHAAIATQTKVEKIIKKEGFTRHSLGREKFLERVRQFAQDSHDTIVDQCKRMGASLDWSREAYTLDETRNKAVNSVFKLMYDDGLIFRGERIVNWCPRCHSTLADDEVEYKESKSGLYFFKYSKDFPITIATTRPETKLGDTAVAVNPKDERYKDFIGKEYEVDFIGIKLKLKIIADRKIDMEFGTGALGVTPAHSQADWQIAEANDLSVIKVIDEDGNIKEGFAEFSGKTAKDARVMVLEKLKESGLMEKEEETDNNLSICYRCNTPIEPLPSLQWFIDVNKKVERLNNKSIKETCQEAVKSGVFGREKIRLIPEQFNKSYFHWMDNLKDWCISRQIWFGHQIPVWHRQSPGKKNELFIGVAAPSGSGWMRDEDTLDTWFSSGMWTFSTLAHSPEEIKIENNRLVIDSDDFRRYHPTQVLETAYDILFFWVARMIIMTTYAVNDIPFHDVYLQGLVQDDKGRKMSKSKGNVINPLDMADSYGADSVRLSLVIGSTPGNDMRLSEEKVAGFRNLTNKLWNISRYVKQSVNLDTEKNHGINHAKLTLSDKWILGELNRLIEKTTSCLDEYKFSEAGENLREFTWNILADWYIEASKFQHGEETDKVLIHVIKRLLKLWHPYIPFVTEKIWKEFSKTQLIIEKWPTSDLFPSSNAANDFTAIMNIITAIRNARSENKVEPNRKIKALIHTDNPELIKENESLIKSLRTGIEEIELGSGGLKPDKSIFITVDNADIFLLGAIDEEKEKARLKDSIEKLQGSIEQLQNKLADQNFSSNAPAKIVENEKERLGELHSKKQKLEEQLAIL